MIHKSDIKDVKSILLDLGYKQGHIINNEFVGIDRKKELFYLANSHQIAPFILKTNIKDIPYIEIDINKELMWGESIYKFDVKNFLAYKESFGLSDKTTFYTLDKIHFFLSLCLHHYKDMNSHYILFVKNRISLRRLCDIYYYLKNNKEECNPEKLLFYSEKYNIKEFIYYCNKIFEDDFLKDYIHKLESQMGKEYIGTFGLNEYEKEKWTIDFFDRVFSGDLRNYLKETLSEKNIKKINYNIENLF